MVRTDLETFANSTSEEVASIQTDLADNVLPEDVKVDFALIDVEKSELECLEGMKKIISRSPNIKIIIEWAGRGVTMTTEQYNAKRDEILAWFYDNNFTFYIIDREDLAGQAFTRTCEDKENFIAVDIQGVRDIGAKLEDNIPMDFIILPNHIDPNTLQYPNEQPQPIFKPVPQVSFERS